MESLRQDYQKKTFIFFILFNFSWAFSSELFGEIWRAECKDMVFEFDTSAQTARGSLLTEAGKILFWNGKIHFDNGVALRAEGENQVDLGINKSRGIVYLVERSAGAQKNRDGIFCKTKIEIITAQGDVDLVSRNSASSKEEPQLIQRKSLKRHKKKE